MDGVKKMDIDFQNYVVSEDIVNSFLKESRLTGLSFEILNNQNKLFDYWNKVEKIKYSCMLVKDWELYINDVKDLTQEDFYDYFLKDMPGDSTIFLFTNEGSFISSAFKFPQKDFFVFSSLYENFFSMDFFQFSDYCVLNPEFMKCKFIDEDGGIHEWSW